MRTLLLLSIVLLLQSCLRLDSNMYNNQKITAYHWDDYQGHVDFNLDTVPSCNFSFALVHELTLLSKDTVDDKEYKISAVYIGDYATIQQDTVILYCHGNRDHMDFYWPRAKLLANVGGKNRFGVMMIDYRGFGLSEGDPTEEGLYQDVTTALEWLKAKGVSSSHLVIYGFSLGSAPATKLLAQPRSTLMPSKLILENPFSSAELMVQDAAQLALPGSFFTNVKVNVAEAIKTVQQPFMLLQSGDDKFLKPASHGEVVYKNYQGSYSEKHVVPNADHSTLQTTWGLFNYIKAVEVFLVK